MKKILMLFTLVLVFISGCSNHTSDHETGFTLKKAIHAFEEEGATIDINQRPMYDLINAKDGVIFYHEEELVKLYEFESEADYERGVEELSILGTFPKRDLVVIETNSKKCIEIFNNAPQ